eukprot:SAG11_NODE_707_length_7651_cov_4.133872_6_plen_83_part_00
MHTPAVGAHFLVLGAIDWSRWRINLAAGASLGMSVGAQYGALKAMEHFGWIAAYPISAVSRWPAAAKGGPVSSVRVLQDQPY